MIEYAHAPTGGKSVFFMAPTEAEAVPQNYYDPAYGNVTVSGEHL